LHVAAAAAAATSYYMLLLLLKMDAGGADTLQSTGITALISGSNIFFPLFCRLPTPFHSQTPSLPTTLGFLSSAEHGTFVADRSLHVTAPLPPAIFPCSQPSNRIISCSRYTFGSISINLGANVVRLSHVRNSRTFFCIGYSFFALGNLANFAALNLAAQSLLEGPPPLLPLSNLPLCIFLACLLQRNMTQSVSPPRARSASLFIAALGAVQFLSNLLFARLVQGDTVRVRPRPTQFPAHFLLFRHSLLSHFLLTCQVRDILSSILIVCGNILVLSNGRGSLRGLGFCCP
jgi:hypothetical protein